MEVIVANNIHDALWAGISHLLEEGVKSDSRGGAVLVAPTPVTTVYNNPQQCVLLNPTRDANPFFHFMEALWMLAGRNDIQFPCHFNKSYSQFSDDGRTMWDAYGWRWRQFFGWDQLTAIIEELRTNPSSRRCVLSMWNGAQPLGEDGPTWNTEKRVECSAGGPASYWTDWSGDFHVATHGGKAVPCNTHAYFDLGGGKLNMTVCCRSNDVIWGAYGANAVHFSFLLMFMAAQLGVPAGTYTQMSNNFHVYTDRFDLDKLEQIADECYGLSTSGASPVSNLEFDCSLQEIEQFVRWADSCLVHNDFVPHHWNSTLLTDAGVMVDAWGAYKAGGKMTALDLLAGVEDWAWREACVDWVTRRLK